MNHEDWMKKAIACAQASEQRGGCAIGAIVVNQDGQIVGTGMSLVGLINDVTLHGESSAIQEACKKMKTVDLKGCTLYTTLESSGMCLSAAIWANMEAVYFGAYAADVPENHYEYKDYSSENLANNSQTWDGSPIKVTGGILREECTELLSGYKNWQKVAA